MSNPSDLNIVTQPDTNKDYFNFKAIGLKIDENYAIKFQWVYDDGTVSEWSPGKFINTSTESVPSAPSATVPSTAIGNIPVTLSAFPENTKRVDIYIIGGVYGSGKVADSFFQAGTKNIPVTAGVYQVSLIAVTPSGINGDPTNTFTITIANIVTEDTTAPDPISAGVVTGGVHPQDSSGQLGYLNIAVTNGTIPADFAGYIVKIVSSTNTWTQTFNSSTALSNLYLTGGLFVGQSYTLSVATTDGKNISSYVNCSPAPYTIADNRTNTSTVTGSLAFSATDSILTVSWTESTDPYVDSYRVQVTSNADTNFASPVQTVESRGTTATFGGLDSNTTYRVRVTARYSGAAGALSTNHTTGTFTLNASGAISDGVAPTTNPALTSSMVKSLFGAFAITFPPVVNSDAVVYEVFIKPDNATGIVSDTYKVLEVGGTFAVVRTLADRTTSLTYGANYYIAIRAKDNDGVSSGTVTAVGPVQTLQVSNADLAADSVYANNIFAGQVDATKLTSDTALVDQKITVGTDSSLNRVRLDATTATISGSQVKSRIYIGGGNYYDTASPFYADNLGRLSIGQKLKFENGELTINGSGTFTGTVTAGSGLNVVSIGNDVQSTNDGIYIGGTGDYIYSDGRVRLGNGGITYAGGVLTVTGNVAATSLASDTTITGTTINAGIFQTSALAGNGSTSGVRINTSGIFGYSSSSATPNFSVTNTGILTALAGTIGGWDINGTQLRSTGTNSITLNPNTPKIALLVSGVEKITIDPVSGIVGPNVTVAGNTGPGFSFSPNGTAVLRGTVYANAGVFTGEVNAGSGSITGNLSVSGNINITSGSLYTQNIGALFGGVRINGSNAAYEFLNGDNNTSGQMYTFNSGNEIILQLGSSRTADVGYPQSTWFQSLSNSGWTVGYASTTGLANTYLNFQGGTPGTGSASISTSASVNSIADTTADGSYFRNISSGSTAISQSRFGYIGDIYIQYA